jgi:hypothetical protein
MTHHAGMAELADAPDLGSGGFIPWRFKSSCPHHIGIQWIFLPRSIPRCYFIVIFCLHIFFYVIISKEMEFTGIAREEHNESKPGKNRKEQGLLKFRD